MKRMIKEIIKPKQIIKEFADTNEEMIQRVKDELSVSIAFEYLGEDEDVKEYIYDNFNIPIEDISSESEYMYPEDFNYPIRSAEDFINQIFEKTKR